METLIVVYDGVPKSFLRVLALVFSTGACGNDRPPQVSPLAVRDSLGIQVVEVDREQLPSWGVVTGTPEWVVGGDSGRPLEHELYGVADVDVFDHEIWIANQGSQEVVRVDRETGQVLRMGGAGDGPTEFRQLQRVWNLGGRGVGAFDRVRQRYVEFSPAGDLLFEWTLPEISDSGDRPDLLRVPMGGEAPEFFLGLVTGLSSGPSSGTHRGVGPLVRAGETIDTVTWLKGSETFYSGDLAGAVFFGGTTLLAEGLGGVWTGDTTLPEVVLWRDNTLPAAVVRWTGSTGVPVSEQRREELWRALEASLPGAEREIVSHLRGLVPFAETVPEFGAIEVSPDGTLWIGAPVPPERQLLDEPWPAQEWLLVDVNARAAGKLETPEGVRVSRVGSDFVLGVHRDQLGVESVRLHRIEWSRPDRE